MLGFVYLRVIVATDGLVHLSTLVALLKKSPELNA